MKSTPGFDQKVNLAPRLSRDGRCTPIPDGWRLSFEAGGGFHYRLAQLDDQQGIARRAYPWRPPLSLSLQARFSDETSPGTWGFGFWNDPFGFSFAPGNGFFRLPSLPNAIWFFHASSRNYLSFRDDKPAQGFLAQTFRSPGFHPSLLPAGLALPFSRKVTRRYLSRIIEEDASRLRVAVTQWHTYRLEWHPNRSSFWVDESQVFESPVSPRPPLGLVIWIDNQYAAFTPQGKLGWGVEENPAGLWLEVKNLAITAQG